MLVKQLFLSVQVCFSVEAYFLFAYQYLLREKYPSSRQKTGKEVIPVKTLKCKYREKEGKKV